MRSVSFKIGRTLLFASAGYCGLPTYHALYIVRPGYFQFISWGLVDSNLYPGLKCGRNALGHGNAEKSIARLVGQTDAQASWPKPYSENTARHLLAHFHHANLVLPRLLVYGTRKSDMNRGGSSGYRSRRRRRLRARVCFAELLTLTPSGAWLRGSGL